MSARHHRTWLSSARKTPSSRIYRTVPLARHSVGRLASMRERFGQDDLKCVRVAVQGIRNVGWHLAPSLSDAGPVLLVSDIHNNRKRVTQRTFAATQVPTYQIYDSLAEIFVPYALGAIINNETLPRLKTKIVTGSANNQLAEKGHGIDLESANILYASDYIINIYHECCAHMTATPRSSTLRESASP
jgi:leucine dehydrogenase